MKRTIRITVPDIAQIRIDEFDDGTFTVSTRPDEPLNNENAWLVLKEKEVWVETPDCPHPVTVLLGLGFAEEETGGGCTALVRRYDDGGYHMITVEDDPSAPEIDDHPSRLVQVGYYAKDEDEASADDFKEELQLVADTFRNNQSLERRFSIPGAR